MLEAGSQLAWWENEKKLRGTAAIYRTYLLILLFKQNVNTQGSPQTPTYAHTDTHSHTKTMYRNLWISVLQGLAAGHASQNVSMDRYRYFASC